jgi:hypothetical protein
MKHHETRHINLQNILIITIMVTVMPWVFAHVLIIGVCWSLVASATPTQIVTVLDAFTAAVEGATIAPETATARTAAVARLRLRRIIVCLSNFFRGMIKPVRDWPEFISR